MKKDHSKFFGMQMKRQFMTSCACFFALPLVPACASTPLVEAKPSAGSSAAISAQLPQTSPTSIPAAPFPTQNIRPSAALPQGSSSANENPKLHVQEAELAQMRIELMSLKEKMASIQRKLELVLKAQRSGLYEAENVESINAAVKNAEPKKSIIPPLGSAGPIDRFDAEPGKVLAEQPLSPESAKSVVDRALADLAQGDFARVAQSLEGFQQRFPSHPLSNAVELALAEAYVELKSPQQALPHLRAFYLQHPNDVEMFRAKWLEARAQEQLQAPQRAAQLYREVIALSPQSDAAMRARAALERIHGGTMQ